MLTKHRGNSSKFNSLLSCLVFSIFCLCCFCGRAFGAQDRPSVQDILRYLYQAAGGNVWQHYEECDSEGMLTVAGKTGSLHHVEDLRSGANVSQAEIPGLDVKRADGDEPRQGWHQDDDGDIQLSNPDSPDKIDNRYLTSHGYWRSGLGGASVTTLSPQTFRSTTWDRRFQIPGGNGFTLWINRQTGLLDRVEGKTTKELTDYRQIHGVMLPFKEKTAAGDEMLTVEYMRRTLRRHLDTAAFALPFRKDYQMPPSGQVSVPAEGGLVFQATIDGKGPFKTIFDTGSVNVLSANLAHKLGLKLDTHVLQGGISSLATVHAHKTHVDTLHIGDLVVHDQIFSVLDIPDVAFVGYELLRRLAVRIDFEGQRLTFYDAPRFHYSGTGTAVPLQFQDKALLVQASIGDASGWFQVDSGNEFGTETYTGFTVKNNLVQALGAHFLAYNGRGVAGPSPQAYLARVNTMRIGDVRVPSVIGHFTTDSSDKRELAGNIGQNILRHFTVLFDCMRGHMYFETTKDSSQPEVFNRAELIFDSFGHGLQVMTVLPGSPGAQADVEPGDVITAIDGKTPDGDEVNPPEFLRPSGSQLQVAVRRGHETHHVSVTLRDIL